MATKPLRGISTTAFDVIEGATARYSAVLKDETDTVIPAASLTALTLTLYNVATGAIINSRNAQNVLNANNVTVDASGNLVWTVQPGDNAIVDTSLDREDHVALFKFEWSSPTKRGYHQVVLRAQNMAKV